jgi:hypothetical protein
MTRTLEVTSRDLDQHLVEASRILLGATCRRQQAHLEAEIAGDDIVAGMVGVDCEAIERIVGGRVNVIAFLPLQGLLVAWLSYRENWRILTGRGKNREFRSASLSVYFGLENEAYKPQVFRAEWAGWAKWNAQATASFQTDAGHPHWQFDALESLNEDSFALRRQALEVLRDPNDEEPVREFGPSPETVRDLVLAQGLSRVHFPSAAAWWRPAPDNGHAFAPGSTIELRLWLSHTLRYLKAELAALRNRRRA